MSEHTLSVDVDQTVCLPFNQGSFEMVFVQILIAVWYDQAQLFKTNNVVS